MADSPGVVLRICQHRTDTSMEICPELLKDKVVQKKVEIRSSEADGAIAAAGRTPRATCKMLQQESQRKKARASKKQGQALQLPI